MKFQKREGQQWSARRRVPHDFPFIVRLVAGILSDPSFRIGSIGHLRIRRLAKIQATPNKFANKRIQALEIIMAKPSHKVKKANHGKRPANNRGRKIKNKKIKTP